MLPRLQPTLCVVLLLAACVLPVKGHQTSDSYLALQLTNSQISGRWAIAIRDLNHVLTLDGDTDGEVSDAELEGGKPNIENYAYNRLKISSDGRACTLRHQSYQIQETDSAIYLVLVFILEHKERIGPDLLVEFSLFFDTDPLHRGLFRLDLPEQTATTIFSPSQPVHRFLLGEVKRTESMGRFVKEGVWHIWIGFDHILFLVALLLPSVLQRDGQRWVAGASLRKAFINVVKIVTAFTIAHSITLTLATLGWVRLPGRLVESVIAVSVFLAALNNLKPIFPERTWTIAFGFGLVHGFGFASALGELELPPAALGLALVGFNAGVELGQLAIVLAFVPIAFLVRQTRFYQQFTLPIGSVLIAVLSVAWLVERLTDKKLLPF